jgi:glutamyl-tRNA synthetase
VLSDAGLSAPTDKVEEMVPLVRERMKTLNDAVSLTDFVFMEEIDYDSQLLVGRRMTTGDSLAALQTARKVLAELPNFDRDTLEAALYPLARETLGLRPGQLFGIIRVAAMGKTVAPPLFGTLAAIGRGRVLSRLDDAVVRLEGAMKLSDGTT